MLEVKQLVSGGAGGKVINGGAGSKQRITASSSYLELHNGYFEVQAVKQWVS